MKPATHHARVESQQGTFDIIVRPCIGAKRVIINYPGHRGSARGYNRKYDRISEYVVATELGAFIQMPNISWGIHYASTLIDDLLTVVDFVQRNISCITAVPGPELCLAGFSAGGGAVVAAAHEARAEKILLMAPSRDAAAHKIDAGLDAFTGELHVVVGDQDNVVSPDVAHSFASRAKSARSVKAVVLPDCDHQFRGEANGRIISQAYHWAFGDEAIDFPNPDAGIWLYD